jgi:hypothetical protein
MNPVKLSILLTVISLLTLVIVTFPLGYLFTKVLGLDIVLALFAFAVVFHIVNYFVVQKILQFKEKKYLISLQNMTDYAPFKGGGYFKFYLGLVWRMVLLNILITPMLENIAPDGGILFSIVSGSLLTFFSYLWLMKYSCGDVKIVFNVGDQGYTLSDDEKILEQVNFSERKSESFISGLKDVIAGSMGGVFFLVYFLIGCFQFAAIYSFFRDVLDWWMIPSMFVSIFSAYTPVVGTFLGVYSAHEAWDWSWLSSILLFTWPFVLVLCFVLGSVIWEFLTSLFKGNR